MLTIVGHDTCKTVLPIANSVVLRLFRPNDGPPSPGCTFLLLSIVTRQMPPDFPECIVGDDVCDAITLQQPVIMEGLRLLRHKIRSVVEDGNLGHIAAPEKFE